MKTFLTLFLALFLGATLEANCSSYHLLGSTSKNLDQTNTKDTIVWQYIDNNWSVLSAQDTLKTSDKDCKDDGYILLNNNEINYTKPIYIGDFYQLQKGWNFISTPIDGLDLVKTFSKVNLVKFVYVYDNHSQTWAAYSPDKNLMNKIQNSKIITLKYIEPNLGFYVYAKDTVKVTIHSKKVNDICRKKMKDERYNLLIDSGINQDFTYGKNNNIGISSRYLSHYRKGIYNDTRVVFIYPKIKKLDPKVKLYRYGPAIPKVMIHYNQAYEDKTFYIYDYFNHSCYEGTFPSVKIPPAPTMKKLK